MSTRALAAAGAAAGLLLVIIHEHHQRSARAVAELGAVGGALAWQARETVRMHRGDA